MISTLWYKLYQYYYNIITTVVKVVEFSFAAEKFEDFENLTKLGSWFQGHREFQVWSLDCWFLLCSHI